MSHIHLDLDISPKTTSNHPQGNAAEHVTSIWMACKGKMELCIGIVSALSRCNC
jgi:hypothetical protein